MTKPDKCAYSGSRSVMTMTQQKKNHNTNRVDNKSKPRAEVLVDRGSVDVGQNKEPRIARFEMVDGQPTLAKSVR